MTAGEPMREGPAWRLEIHDELGSTSDLILARTHEPPGLAVLARRQTKGRGSHGRTWAAPEGNLNLSLLLRPTRQAPWALLLAVAVHEALAKYLPDPTILTLKWPNDLLLNGRKLAGILLESGPGWLVIGIGVNLREAPKLPDRPPAALAEIAAPPTQEAAAAAILSSISHWLQINSAEGFDPIRTAWLAAAAPPGTRLHVTQPHISMEGTFIGLDQSGALLLQTETKLLKIHAGEIT